MTVQGARSERLLDDMYDAAADDRLWPGVIKSIADLVDGGGGVVHVFSMATHRVLNNFSYIGGLDETCLQIALDRYLDNPWSHQMWHQPEMKIVNSDAIVPLPVLSRTAFYNECVRPQNLPHNAMAKLVCHEDAVLAFNISRHRPFDRDQLAVLDRLLPDVRRAFMLNMRMDGYKALYRADHHVLDRLPEGVLLLDRVGRVLFANRAAGTFNGLSLSRLDNRLRVLAAAQQSRLDRAMQEVVQGAASATLLLRLPDRSQPLSVLILRARESVLDRLAPHSLGRVAMLMFIRDPERAMQVPQQRLAAAYGLTPAESRVALRAAEGLDVPAMAAALNLSGNTVKTHMRRIYSKMGIDRQAQLVRLMNSLDLG